MGFKSFFSSAKMHNAWSGLKQTIGKIYHPVASVIHKGTGIINKIDNLIDKGTNIGIPSALLDVIKDNPIWDTVTGTARTVDDLFQKDLPRLGNVVDNFVNKEIIDPRKPHSVVRPTQANRPSHGFTVNLNPTSRQHFTGNSSA